MGELGWSTIEVDAMELWQVARFLGVGGAPPVIRGASHRRIADGAVNEHAGAIDRATWGDSAPLAAQFGQQG